jgi:hypothetical protein
MKGFLRRLRGIIGTGLTWAVGWAGLWCAYFLVLAGLGLVGEGVMSFPVFLVTTIFIAGWGFIAGGLFGLGLSILERHKKLEDLSLWRVALWGGLGGSLLTVVFNLTRVGYVHWPAVLTFFLISAGLSSGTVALARRADTKLIEGEEESLPALEGEEEALPALEGE